MPGLGRKSFPGTVLDVTHHVTHQSTVNASGDVFYTATIVLPKGDPSLRWRMTVRVEFK